MPSTKVPGSTITSDIHWQVHDVFRRHGSLPAEGIRTRVCIGNECGVVYSLPLDGLSIEVESKVRVNLFLVVR